jgi:hypothetical protein
MSPDLMLMTLLVEDEEVGVEEVAGLAYYCSIQIYQLQVYEHTVMNRNHNVHYILYSYEASRARIIMDILSLRMS